MKRGGPLKRTKPLDGGDPLRRSTPLRSGPSREGKAKPKRKPVDGPSEATQERQAKELVGRRSGGDCEVRSPWHLGRATNFSHRRHDGQGGPWSASNGLNACGWGNATGCHGYIHQHPEEARENGWVVPSWQDWRTAPALIWHKGRRAKHLLDDEGGCELAPFPQGDPRHPDDIPLKTNDDDKRGAA